MSELDRSRVLAAHLARWQAPTVHCGWNGGVSDAAQGCREERGSFTHDCIARFERRRHRQSGVGVEGGNSTNIRVNYRLGMQSAIEYLYQLGHRRIAFIGHHMNLSPLQERYDSFVAMGSQYRETEFFGVSAHDSPSGGAEATREILDSGFDPTVILCVNDYIAIGVLAELRDRGIQVPRQVSVIGFDNISLAPFVHPPLTTVNIPRARIAELMFQALTAGEIPDTVLGKEISVRPELVIRGTTGPARVPRASGLTGDGERTVPDCAGSSTGKSSTARQAPP